MRVAALLLLLAGCTNTTAGALISLPFAVGGVEQASAGPLSFTTSAGWDVALDQAKVALGPFYFNDQSPSTEVFRSGLFIVELTEQVIVDPLDPTLTVASDAASGETGDAVACEIDLLPPDSTQSTDDDALIGSENIGLIAGTAQKDGVSIPFDGPLVIDTSSANSQNPTAALERIRGASVDLTFTADPATLELRVDPTLWFDEADFSTLLDGTPDSSGTYTWDRSSTFEAAVIAGVKGESGVYTFSLDPG